MPAFQTLARVETRAKAVPRQSIHDEGSSCFHIDTTMDNGSRLSRGSKSPSTPPLIEEPPKQRSFSCGQISSMVEEFGNADTQPGVETLVLDHNLEDHWGDEDTHPDASLEQSFQQKPTFRLHGELPLPQADRWTLKLPEPD